MSLDNAHDDFTACVANLENCCYQKFEVGVDNGVA